MATKQPEIRTFEAPILRSSIELYHYLEKRGAKIDYVGTLWIRYQAEENLHKEFDIQK